MDKSVLRKALADTEEPTPGYLFRDIAQSCRVPVLAYPTALPLIALSYFLEVLPDSGLCLWAQRRTRQTTGQRGLPTDYRLQELVVLDRSELQI